MDTVRTTFSVTGKFERDVIAERTREGLASARARGRKGGRPRVNDEIVNKAINLYRIGQYSAKNIEELTGVKRTTLYKNLKQ